LGSALVAVSFPPRIRRDGPEVSKLLGVLEQAQAIRRTGSAALNMCYVASGRLDAYWATGTSAWDIAAGVLLVTEAGGTVTDLSGDAFELSHPQPLAAATPELNAELAAILRT
jgi:myo-inositol-1(or 4)-monophosphatase